MTQKQAEFAFPQASPAEIQIQQPICSFFPSVEIAEDTSLLQEKR